jgi:hypothetical protein
MNESIETVTSTHSPFTLDEFLIYKNDNIILSELYSGFDVT